MSIWAVFIMELYHLDYSYDAINKDKMKYNNKIYNCKYYDKGFDLFAESYPKIHYIICYITPQDIHSLKP